MMAVPLLKNIESHKYAYRWRHKNVYLSVYNTESCKEPEIGVIYSGLKKKRISFFKDVFLILHNMNKGS